MTIVFGESGICAPSIGDGVRTRTVHPERLRAPTQRGPRTTTVRRRLADDYLGLHLRMDGTHEVERAALLRRDLHVDRLTLLARPGETGVPGPVDVGRRSRTDAVLDVLELRRSLLVVRVEPERDPDRGAHLAVVDLPDRPRQLRLLDDREGVRALGDYRVDDVQRPAGAHLVHVLVPAQSVKEVAVGLHLELLALLDGHLARRRASLGRESYPASAEHQGKHGHSRNQFSVRH